MTTHAAVAVDGHLDPEFAGGMNKLGVILLIVGDAFFTLSLVFTYLYLRGLNTNGLWMGKDVHPVSTAFSWVIVLVVVASWAAYRWGERGGNDKARIALGVGVASALVLVDVVMQVVQMVGAGFTPRDGAYASAWMALAGYHVVHLLLSLFLGIGIMNRARVGRFAQTAWHVRLVGYWWSWLVLAAVLIAATTSLTTVTPA